MRNKYTHDKDCTDQAAANADRRSHDAAAKKREARQQQLARAEWFEWYPRSGPDNVTIPVALRNQGPPVAATFTPLASAPRLST